MASAEDQYCETDSTHEVRQKARDTAEPVLDMHQSSYKLDSSTFKMSLMLEFAKRELDCQIREGKKIYSHMKRDSIFYKFQI